MTYKVKSNTSDHYSKRKSNIFQESPLTKRIATKHKPLLISATYHKVDQTRDKFPGCISLVSISFVKRISSFLRFTDFLIVAYSANSKAKVFAKYQSGSCQDCLKLQNTAMQILSFIFLTNIKL